MEEGGGALPAFDLRPAALWAIIRMQWRIIAAFTALVLVGTLIISLMTTKEYRATAVVRLDPFLGQEVRSQEVVDYSAMRSTQQLEEFYMTHVRMMKSSQVRDEIVKNYEKLKYDDLPVDKGGSDRLSGLLLITREENTQLINVSVTHTDPERAAVLANLTAEAYREFNLRTRQEAALDAKRWLEGKLGEYGDRINGANAALLTFKQEKDMVDVEERITALTARMDTLSQAYAETSTQRVMLDTQVGRQQDLLKRGDGTQLAKVVDSLMLQTLNQSYARALTEQATVAARYGENHPKRQEADAELQRIREQTDVEVRRAIDAEKARIGVLLAEEASLKREIEGIKNELLGKQTQRAEYDKLVAELTRTKEFAAKLGTRNDELDLQSRTQLNNIRIIDRAKKPAAPIRPNIPLNLGIALIVGIAGGITLGFLREYIDDTINSPLDVAAYLKVPFLGLVPKLPASVEGKGASMYTFENPRSTVAEAIRSLRTMLELNPNGAAPRRFLVTSSIASEGKTDTTTRLGVAFAKVGKRVVLIDADLRRARIHKVFGLQSDPGLTTALAHGGNILDCVQQTPIANLFCVPSGPYTDRPNELLAQPNVRDVLDELQRHYDVIIVDTPPSAVLSDAILLSKHVDGVLVVARAHKVSRVLVKQTLDRLLHVEAPILGLVLNAADITSKAGYYKYYYGYRNYYYYGYENEAAASAPTKTGTDSK